LGRLDLRFGDYLGFVIWYLEFEALIVGTGRIKLQGEWGCCNDEA
jgi:hypothetical protein